MKEDRPPETASESLKSEGALSDTNTLADAADATEGQDGGDIRQGWRLQATDFLFHCFTEGQERSLCGGHPLGRLGATAMLDDIPEEALCPFCVAVLRSGG